MANTPAPGATVVDVADVSPDAMVPLIQGPQSSITKVSSLFGSGAIPRGTFTATSTSAVTVADTRVTANSLILITLKTAAGTPAAQPYPDTITPGVGFTVKAGSGDTSVYNYAILG